MTKWMNEVINKRMTKCANQGRRYGKLLVGCTIQFTDKQFSFEPSWPTNSFRSSPVGRQTVFVRAQLADKQISFEPNLPTNIFRSSPLCRQTFFVRAQFADKQFSFEPNLPTNRTFLEFCQQYKVDEHYGYAANVPTS